VRQLRSVRPVSAIVAVHSVLGPYMVEFCCVALKLVVEVDGEHHFIDQGLQHDRRRDQYLRDVGYDILRIPGYDVLRDSRDARTRIEEAIRKRREG